ncbi:MAG TPA: ECF transporter S component [Clostridia bacterium]|jgi:riboflavin transporter FmnP|nr:ECF transporter S component [Clostridia bacterium]HOM33951.1 ECF transporter S component [Clostridia bacterium]HOR89471.1 ECF transporter S component [Clostridia bacterium]HOT69781.1 ECF transporter S component [Clostridia bacterium]HPL07514.1 ECF transporter S component [Clostridia bacterium]
MEQHKTKLMTTRNMAKMGILGAVAGVLMLLEIPLPFAPAFYEIDLSEVAVFLGTFAMGPVAGIIIEAVKILVNLVITGTATAGVGEFANFLIGCCLVVPAGIIYKRKKNIKNAIIGMLVGIVSMTVAGALLNYFLLIPTYAKAFGMPVEAIVEMGTKINPNINSLWDLILLANVPFNLLKGVLSGVITFLIYKRLSPILHK